MNNKNKNEMKITWPDQIYNSGKILIQLFCMHK